MTDSSERPEDPADLVPSPSFEVPVITASLSRRALRQRLEASSVEPVVETRRERRERELAAASAAASAASEVPAPRAVPIPAAAAPPTPSLARVVESSPKTDPVGEVSTTRSAPATRRARRDASGLEHLLRAPAAVPALPAVEAPAVVDVPSAEAAPAASGSPALAAMTPAPAVAPVATTAAPSAAVASPAASASAVPVANAAVRSAPALAAEPSAPAAAPPAPAAAAAATQSGAEELPAARATSVHTMTFSREDEASAPARGPVAAPRGARSSVSSGDPRRRVLPRMRRAAAPRPDGRKRTVVNTAVMVATAGLVATIALPAYAYSDVNSLENPKLTASSELGIQSLTVAGVNAQDSSRDTFTTTGNIAAMDSTNGTTVSPTVQALAAELMADVASGKLVGSVPDHIVEIRNLANGVAVPGCGVDYRVLQTIKVAVDNFDKVGVSDINRHCTGQIEGAGTASSHYKDGGGHAVDFYILNGHGLTGADSDSIKLINLLDPLVPKGSGLGQAECRSTSLSLSNFAPFDDTCTHVHVDFGAAQGVALKS